MENNNDLQLSPGWLSQSGNNFSLTNCWQAIPDPGALISQFHQKSVGLAGKGSSCCTSQDTCGHHWVFSSSSFLQLSLRHFHGTHMCCLVGDMGTQHCLDPQLISQKQRPDSIIRSGLGGRIDGTIHLHSQLIQVAVASHQIETTLPFSGYHVYPRTGLVWNPGNYLPSFSKHSNFYFVLGDIIENLQLLKETPSNPQMTAEGP